MRDKSSFGWEGHGHKRARRYVRARVRTVRCLLDSHDGRFANERYLLIARVEDHVVHDVFVLVDDPEAGTEERLRGGALVQARRLGDIEQVEGELGVCCSLGWDAVWRGEGEVDRSGIVSGDRRGRRGHVLFARVPRARHLLAVLLARVADAGVELRLGATLHPYALWVAELDAIREAVAVAVLLAECLGPHRTGRLKVRTELVSRTATLGKEVADTAGGVVGAVLCGELEGEEAR